MPKVLVVDDEEHIRMLYEEELKSEGYEVVTVATGRGILDLIEKEKPDICLLYTSPSPRDRTRSRMPSSA